LWEPYAWSAQIKVRKPNTGPKLWFEGLKMKDSLQIPIFKTQGKSWGKFIENFNKLTNHSNLFRDTLLTATVIDLKLEN